MRVLNDLLLDNVSVALSQESEEIRLDHIQLVEVVASVTSANSSNKTFDTGTMEVQTLTFPSLVGATAGDYIVFYDSSSPTAAWAISLNKTGADPAPTGAAWAAIAAGRKVHVDISLAVTAAQVAAAVEVAVDALTGLTALIVTDDTAADGTMLFTQTVPGPTTNPVPHNANDSGVGSISGVQTTAGVATEVDPTANTVTIPSHGFTTGAKLTELTAVGTLPAGLSTGTVYYVIVVDANTIKFATTQANALAGTAVDITGYGATTTVSTLVVATSLVGTIKLQKNSEPDNLDPIWVDIGSSSQNITATATFTWGLSDIGYCGIRAVAAMTSGTVTARARINGKGF
jgi:hypothetical protein